jgi:long-subunit fatty acid transport protein
MCFGPFCPNSQIDFAGTFFIPEVKGEVTGPVGPMPGMGIDGTIKDDSEDEVYAIPAFGLSVPITDGLSPPDWRFGLAAYGVSGHGVDYRESKLDQPNFFPFSDFGAPADGPLITGEYTQLQSMRFAPAIGFQPWARASFSKLLIEADVKWINWGDADGYKDFDWDDQWVFAVRAQYEPISTLHLRAGYNFAKTPLDNNDGFDGTQTRRV